MTDDLATRERIAELERELGLIMAGLLVWAAAIGLGIGWLVGRRR